MAAILSQPTYFRRKTVKNDSNILWITPILIMINPLSFAKLFLTKSSDHIKGAPVKRTVEKMDSIQYSLF